MALNLAFSGAAAHIQGHAAGQTILRETQTGKIVRIAAGRFNKTLPAGRYVASAGGMEWNLELLNGRLHRISFDPHHAIDMSLSSSADDTDVVKLKLELHGHGKHEIALRLFNCETSAMKKRVILKKGATTTLEWELRVTDKQKPWVAVAIPDSDPELRREAFGRLGSYSELT
jgi:hypothetical protein